MATVIADVAADIKDRLIIGSTAQEPTTTMLSTWLRNNLTECIGMLKPIKRTALSVTSHTATLDADQVFYVSDGIKTLFRDVEWGDDGASIYLDSAVAATGIVAWYFKDPAITGATTSVDTSCIFGGNWLQELATLMTMAQAYERLANTATDQNDKDAASMLRVEWTDRIDRLYKWKRGEWDNWQSRMEQGMQRRASLGDLPFRLTAGANFVNKSRIYNPATGARTGA